MIVLPVAGLHDQHYQFLSSSNLMVGGVVRLAGWPEGEESTMGNVDAKQVSYTSLCTFPSNALSPPPLSSPRSASQPS